MWQGSALEYPDYALPTANRLEALDLAEAHIRAAQAFTRGELLSLGAHETATKDLSAALEYIDAARHHPRTETPEVAALRSVAVAAHAFMQAEPCETRDHNVAADGTWLERDAIDCDECHAVEQVREALAKWKALETGSEGGHR